MLQVPDRHTFYLQIQVVTTHIQSIVFERELLLTQAGEFYDVIMYGSRPRGGLISSFRGARNDTKN